MHDATDAAMVPIPRVFRDGLHGASQWSVTRLSEYLALTVCGVHVGAWHPVAQRLICDMGEVIGEVATQVRSVGSASPAIVEPRAIQLVTALSINDVWTVLDTFGVANERVACRIDELEVQLRAILRDELCRIALSARMPTTDLVGTPAMPLEPGRRLRLVRG